MRPARTRALILLLALGIAGACAPRRAFDNPERPAPTPYPEGNPPFGLHELHEQMWKLAGDVERINVIMRHSTEPLSREEQQEIVGLLDSMDTHAQRLAEPAARELHPVLGKNIDLFRRDITIARRHAAADPPNFFMAGTVAGACAYCHGTGFDQVHGSVGRPSWNR